MDKSFKALIMSISNFFKRQMGYLAIAMSGVEKNALGQGNSQLEDNVIQERRHTQGQLVDSLKHGEITQEVVALRWRTYKILQASEGLTAEITGYDENGMPIVKTYKKDRKRGLKKIRQDEFDKYQLEMVVDNSDIVISGNEASSNDNISMFNEAVINKNKEGDVVSATHGEVTGLEYFATNKPEKPILIIRNALPNFELETFTQKLHIRKIDETNRLLEFYVTKYPDEYNRTSRFFISEVKKIIENNKQSTLLDILGVNFITYKTIGSDDFLEYKYNIVKFDKVIEFNGYYVIKFIGKVVIDGKNIFDGRRVIELDEKYNNKTKK